MRNNTNVCRFCLQLVPDANVELINEVTQKILEVLLIKLDLEVSEDPTICKICSVILDEIYTFKSKCLYSEDIISAHFESNIKVTLMDILIELENERYVNIAEDEVICRLCIKIPPNSSYIALINTDEESSHCRDMIQMQLPEINLNITKKSIICEACHVLLKHYLSFATSCMDVEQQIKMYRERQGSDFKEQVDLLHVMQFTENKAKGCENSFNGNLIIELEESSAPVKVEKVEEVEKNNLLKDLLTNGNSREFYIKEEEKIEIKSEDDQTSYDECTYSTNVTESQLHDKCEHHMTLLSHTELGETVVYYCATCDFKSKYKNSLKDHVNSSPVKADSTDSRVKFQCTQCDFRTKNRSSYCVHKRRHDPTKYEFKCEQCKYSTYHQSGLKRHLLTHVKLGDTRAYYCTICNFKSKYKGSLERHRKICLKKKEKCDTNSGLIYQCSHCNFRTNSRTSLSKHKLRHDPTKPKIKCEQCEYSTYIRSNFNQHLVTHMALGETKVYYCATCRYKAKRKSSLTCHMKRCPNKKEETTKINELWKVQNILIP